ncbi:hypothetical protein H181DRAFT_02502 [Streptomyces sp. WMMB 714]|nr:hypothetical protein H181DRAFT_02502 [Streptomyces sp. WMMB 714]
MVAAGGAASGTALLPGSSVRGCAAASGGLPRSASRGRARGAVERAGRRAPCDNGDAASQLPVNRRVLGPPFEQRTSRSRGARWSVSGRPWPWPRAGAGARHGGVAVRAGAAFREGRGRDLCPMRVKPLCLPDRGRRNRICGLLAWTSESCAPLDVHTPRGRRVLVAAGALPAGPDRTAPAIARLPRPAGGAFREPRRRRRETRRARWWGSVAVRQVRAVARRPGFRCAGCPGVRAGAGARGGRRCGGWGDDRYADSPMSGDDRW